MSKTFEQGKDEVARLCRYFATNAQAFLAPGVKEAHVRQSLIDPFFEALGWDVRNTAMAAPQYREVIPEDSLDVEGHQKAPDYTFRVGPLPKFYAEAKKCGVNINADPGPAYQLRRYGWSAKVAVSILTDFQELGVYDCTSRPRPSDKASHARIQYFRFEEYPDRWRELWDVFSREAVWSGAFDQYAASKRKRGTSEVDVEFLKEIEGWRDALARNIAIRNKNLSPDDLNTAVQMTIDRIVFLRMAEDRGIEPFEQLLKLCERPDIYPRFIRDLCRRADEKYNSGLFHFKKEAEISEAPDLITPKLTIDDKVFKLILQSLYFEYGSPYHFGVLPVEILGTVYERFLGKVIRLTAGHQAKIEEKPEVRKAGGVYYTPSYIVDYIVKNTVGKQIEGKSPAQLEGIKGKPPFRVLDMACGSGSFLLGAYQCLLDHCLKWYVEHKPAAHTQAVFQDARNGQWRLTIEEKKRILTAHIFGVDIDPQAVEVSKLSLLLKALEGEDDASLSRQLALFHDRVLPNLSDNIKCGNSLIGPDYFTGKLIAEPDEMKRVNPFDWNQGFPNAMKVGGFDCVIGNPPYLKLTMTNLDQNTADYYNANYKSLSSGSSKNLFQIFIERVLYLEPRIFSYIVPEALLTTSSNKLIRSLMLKKMNLAKLVVFDHFVFEKATIGSTIFVLERDKHSAEVIVEKLYSQGTTREIKKLILEDRAEIWDTSSRNEFRPILEKARRCSIMMKELVEMSKGMVVKDRKNFLRSSPKSGDLPFLLGNSMGRYELDYKFFANYDDLTIVGGTRNFYKHVQTPRLLIRRTGDVLCAVYSSEKELIESTLYILTSTKCHFKYLLGILNSKLLTFYLRQKLITNVQGFPQVLMSQLEQLPIRLINVSDPADKARHDRMVSLVDSMLALYKQLADAKSEAQKGIIQRQIDATDREIDQLVYELYGLTEEEIAVVEEGVK